jgi:rhamnulokinase
MPVYALAVDIGASSGRHVLGCVRDGKLTLEEVYRFPNAMVTRNGHLCWNTDEIWADIREGMKKCKALGKIPATVGVDTWGVDYVLLDALDRPVGDCVTYRDSRSEAVQDRISDKWLFRRNGIAHQPFNTVYQLMAEPPQSLLQAERCLMMPDYFHFLLSGVKANEYTDASTSALLNAKTKTWDDEVLTAASIPARLFPQPPLPPGTRLGGLRPEVAKEVGYDCEVVLPASHDTGSAFMAVPARDERAVTLSSGTWSLLGVETDAPVLSEAARKGGFTNEGGYGGSIRFLHNIMGLWMLQSIRREQGNRFAYSEMADQAEKAAAYMPVVNVADKRFLAPADMTREVCAALREAGFPLPASDGELYRCLFRSLARGYAQDVAALETLLGKRFNALHMVGGGSQNRVLNQWIANETGLPVYAGPREGTALGNVIAQLIALGEIAGLSQARAMIRRNFAVQTYLPEMGEDL